MITLFIIHSLYSLAATYFVFRCGYFYKKIIHDKNHFYKESMKAYAELDKTKIVLDDIMKNNKDIDYRRHSEGHKEFQEKQRLYQENSMFKTQIEKLREELKVIKGIHSNRTFCELQNENTMLKRKLIRYEGEA